MPISATPGAHRAATKAQIFLEVAQGTAVAIWGCVNEGQLCHFSVAILPCPDVQKKWALVLRRERITGRRIEAGRTRSTLPGSREGCRGEVPRREGGRMKKNGERNDQRDRVKQSVRHNLQKADFMALSDRSPAQTGEMSDPSLILGQYPPLPLFEFAEAGGARPVLSQHSPTHEYCFGDMSRCREPSPKHTLSQFYHTAGGGDGHLARQNPGQRFVGGWWCQAAQKNAPDDISSGTIGKIFPTARDTARIRAGFAKGSQRGIWRISAFHQSARHVIPPGLFPPEAPVVSFHLALRAGRVLSVRSVRSARSKPSALIIPRPSPAKCDERSSRFFAASHVSPIPAKL